MRTSVVVCAVGTGVGAAVALAWCTYRHLQKKRVFEWTYVGTLKEITMFPVKSCHGMELESVECDFFGLLSNGFRDRRLVLLDEDGRVGYAAVHLKMLSIKSEIAAPEVLTLTAPNQPALTINITEVMEAKGTQVTQKRMKGYRLPLVECYDEHHAWFSQAVLAKESGLRLFISLDPVVDRCLFRKVQTDLMPFMVLHDRSLDDLNSRLSDKNKAHHQQFRDNLLVETIDSIQAFDEDNWRWLKIGDDDTTATILRYNSPCLRCILPNVNIDTCERNADFEPLRTLKKFRLRSHKVDPEMGVYFDLYKAGRAQKGDAVYVQYKQ